MRHLVPKLHVLAAILVIMGCTATKTPTATSSMQHGDAPHKAHVHNHPFRGAERWSKILDDPARDAWQKPDEVVRAADIAEGMVVADVGAGTGYFEPRLSRAVGAQGRVYALDIEPDLVSHMKERFRKTGLRNVEARLARPSNPGLADRSVDRIIVVDTWHHISDRSAYAKALRKALAPNGRIVIVDYTAEAAKGPPKEMRVSPTTVIQELESAGFKAHLVPETLSRHFIVVGESTGSRKP